MSDIADFFDGGESEEVPVSAFFDVSDLLAVSEEAADPDLPA